MNSKVVSGSPGLDVSKLYVTIGKT